MIEKDFENWKESDFKRFIKLDVNNFRLIPKKYIDYQLSCLAVKEASHLISEIDDSFIDRNIVEISIKAGGKNLCVVPEKYIDEDLCIMAINKKPKIIKDIIEKDMFPLTKKMIMTGFNVRSNSLAYLNDQSFELLNKDDIDTMLSKDVSIVKYFPIELKAKGIYDNLCREMKNIHFHSNRKKGLFELGSTLRDLVYGKEAPKWYNKEWLYEKVKEFPFVYFFLFSQSLNKTVQTSDLLFFAIKNIVENPYEKMEDDIKVIFLDKKFNKEDTKKIVEYLLENLNNDQLGVVFSDMETVDNLRLAFLIEKESKINNITNQMKL